MAEKNEETISMERARRAVEITCQRLALVHLAYARTIVNELGEKKGKKLILKAIKDYGKRIGTQVRKGVIEQGLEPVPSNYGAGTARDLPEFGMHTGRERVTVNGEQRTRAYGCVLGELWLKEGEGKLGRLYCYVDPIKYMAFNPDYKLIHTQCTPEGGGCCELAVRPTTEQERADFENPDADWEYIDR
jgi:hypothetical protein